MAHKKILCIDFDGVIHRYNSGWKGVDVIPDEPVPGAIQWLTSLVQDDEFEPMIYSSRSKETAGIDAMREWLLKHGMDSRILEDIEFPTQKPPAFLTIDDRAICFRGLFPDLERLKGFRTWYEPLE